MAWAVPTNLCSYCLSTNFWYKALRTFPTFCLCFFYLPSPFQLHSYSWENGDVQTARTFPPLIILYFKAVFCSGLTFYLRKLHEYHLSPFRCAVFTVLEPSDNSAPVVELCKSHINCQTEVFAFTTFNFARSGRWRHG